MVLKFRQFFRLLALAATASSLLACGIGGGGGGNTVPTPVPTTTSSPTPTSIPTPTPTPATTTPSPTLVPNGEVTISGKVTFDLVPHAANGALDYANTQIAPARGVTLQLMDASGTELVSVKTDSNGDYSMTAPANTNVRVRVRAEVIGPSWEYEVVNNTNGDALYVLDGSLVTSSNTNSIRNLHAASGWDLPSKSYSGVRSAAPFAILDAIYEAMAMVSAANPNVRLPLLSLNWSTQNIAINGDLPGEIGTSNYNAGEQKIFILGYDDNDTDEFDRSVLQHEFAHFLESELWRSDNIGGNHSFNSKSDMRLAFGEGFANAFACMASGDSAYSDSFGANQDVGFTVSLESEGFGVTGWYTETSVGRIIYDLFDSNNDGADTLSLGFTPLYNVLSSSSYINNVALTSIYLLASELKKVTSDAQDVIIDNLMQEQNIFGVSEFGVGETNDGGDSNNLPVYHSISSGSTVNVCTDRLANKDADSTGKIISYGEFNGVDVTRFLRFDLTSSASHKIQVSRSSGILNSDPDFKLFGQGADYPQTYNIAGGDTETNTGVRAAGSYVLEVYSYLNKDQLDETGGAVCFNVSLD